MLTLAVWLGLLASGARQPKEAAQPSTQVQVEPETPLDPELARHRAYLQAKANARSWLDGLDYDLKLLQEKGIDGYWINGIKTWAELLDSYLVLYLRTADDAQRATIAARVDALARQASGPRFHVLQTYPANYFKSNSMSYMRLCWLMEAFKLDATEHRQALQALKPRYDEHLESRGPWQRQMFALYYAHMGWDLPPVLRLAYHRLDGPIAARTPAAEISTADEYVLTHLVYVPSFYGYSRMLEDHFAAEELAYLETTLPALLQRHIAAREWDIAAELLSCMNLLGWRGCPAARQAADALMAAQNASGSWGEYVELAAEKSPAVAEHARLHTTLVSLRALAEHHEPLPWQ